MDRPSSIHFSFQPFYAFVRYGYKKCILSSLFLICDQRQDELSESARVHL